MIRPPLAQAPCRFAHHVEAAFEVDRDLRVEQRVITLRDAREAHDAGIVDDYIDAAEGGLRRIEHARHCGCVAYVRLSGRGLAASRLDCPHQLLCVLGAACIIDDHPEAVGRQSARDCSSDAARGAGHDGDPRLIFTHLFSPEIVRSAKGDSAYRRWSRRDNVARNGITVRKIGTMDAPWTGLMRCAFSCGL